jgi:adenosylcobinamide-GDP ribazoletransferase
MLDRFFSTLSVVTRIPIKLRFTFDSSRMDFYLPLTGIFPALFGLLLFIISSLFFNFQNVPVVILILILIVQYLGFNLFHLDGLMDTADAFLGSADREKRLLILKDSRIGVYGFFAAVSVLGLKAALLYSLFPFARNFPALVFAYPLWGRFSAALVPCIVKPLNPESLGALAKDSRPRRCVFGMALALFLWMLPIQGLGVLISTPGMSPIAAMNETLSVIIITTICLSIFCPLVAFYYATLYRNFLGGYTGDALGAAIETAEVLCGLVTLTACLSLKCP